MGACHHSIVSADVDKTVHVKLAYALVLHHLLQLAQLLVAISLLLMPKNLKRVAMPPATTQTKTGITVSDVSLTR